MLRAVGARPEGQEVGTRFRQRDSATSGRGLAELDCDWVDVSTPTRRESSGSAHCICVCLSLIQDAGIPYGRTALAHTQTAIGERGARGEGHFRGPLLRSCLRRCGRPARDRTLWRSHAARFPRIRSVVRRGRARLVERDALQRSLRDHRRELSHRGVLRDAAGGGMAVAATQGLGQLFPLFAVSMAGARAVLVGQWLRAGRHEPAAGDWHGAVCACTAASP